MAQRILPQFASWPKIAAFVRLEVITDFASVTACSFVSAPTIFTSNRAVHPSPSPAIFLASVSLMMFNAFTNAS